MSAWDEEISALLRMANEEVTDIALEIVLTSRGRPALRCPF